MRQKFSEYLQGFLKHRQASMQIAILEEKPYIKNAQMPFLQSARSFEGGISADST